jgi:hypothetical protein
LMPLLPLLVSRCAKLGNASSMNTVRRLFELYGSGGEAFDAEKYVNTLLVDSTPELLGDVYRFAHPLDMVFDELGVTNWVVGNEERVLRAVSTCEAIPFCQKARAFLGLVPWLVGDLESPVRATYRAIFRDPETLTSSSDVRSTLVAVLRMVPVRSCRLAVNALVDLDTDDDDDRDLTCAIVTLIMCLGEKERALWKDTNTGLLCLLMRRERYRKILLNPSTKRTYERTLVTYAQTALRATAHLHKFGSNACKAAVIDTYVMHVETRPDPMYVVRLVHVVGYFIPHWLVGTGETCKSVPALNRLVREPGKFRCAIADECFTRETRHKYVVVCPSCSCTCGLLAYLKWVRAQTCPRCSSHEKRTIVNMCYQTYMDEDASSL